MEMNSLARRKIQQNDARLGVPMCLYWSNAEMQNWMERIGYPQYRVCMERNNLKGRHLIQLDACSLPDMGIRDFDHIKDITRQVRRVLGITAVSRSSNTARADPMVVFLDLKSQSGKWSDNLTYQRFLRQNRKWFPSAAQILRR